MLELAAVGAGGAVAGVVLGVLGSLVGTTLIAALRLDLLPVDPWGLPSPGLPAAAVTGVPLCVSLGGTCRCFLPKRWCPSVRAAQRVHNRHEPLCARGDLNPHVLADTGT
jgi:hypothetical protein